MASLCVACPLIPPQCHVFLSNSFRAQNWFLRHRNNIIIKLWIYENHIRKLRGEELYKSRSSQLEMQLLQLRKESLKKIQACTGFEPLTSAIPVQRSTN